MEMLFRDGLMGFAWLSAAGVLVCSACQFFRLAKRRDRED